MMIPVQHVPCSEVQTWYDKWLDALPDNCYLLRLVELQKSIKHIAGLKKDTVCVCVCVCMRACVRVCVVCVNWGKLL